MVEVHAEACGACAQGSTRPSPMITRVVLDLDQAHPYSVKSEGNRIVLTVSAAVAVVRSGAPVAAKSGSLTGIFRRQPRAPEVSAEENALQTCAIRTARHDGETRPLHSALVNRPDALVPFGARGHSIVVRASGDVGVGRSLRSVPAIQHGGEDCSAAEGSVAQESFPAGSGRRQRGEAGNPAEVGFLEPTRPRPHSGDTDSSAHEGRTRQATVPASAFIHRFPHRAIRAASTNTANASALITAGIIARHHPSCRTPTPPMPPMRQLRQHRRQPPSADTRRPFGQSAQSDAGRTVRGTRP